MTYHFDATHLFAQDDGYMVMIGFADDEFDPSKSIILQKAHVYDEQDKQMGMDKIHIQVEDESRSKYGGIKAIMVGSGKITIALADEARSSLQLDGDIEINASNDHPAFEEVISQLRDISEADGIAFKN